MPEAIIDACCFINLYATGDIRRFLSAVKWSWHVSRISLAESIFVRTRDSWGEETREAIRIQEFVDEGSICLVDLAGDVEVELFVRLASELDDGEALALAIAKQRSWIVATDDRKARKFASNLGVSVVTTPELVRTFVEIERIPTSEIKILLDNIESRARFSPGEDAPEYDWWVSNVCR